MTDTQVLGIILVCSPVVLFAVVLCVFFVRSLAENHVGHQAWQEGYDQGVHDERQAAAIDIPEYRQPGRANPYAKRGRS